MKRILCLLVAAALSACAGPEFQQIGTDVQRVFTYDYQLDGKAKPEIWRAARNYFAETYGDSRSVIRVQDADEGLIIGKALVPWTIDSGMAVLECHSDYHVRFMAKDNRARLQLELIDGASLHSACTGWDVPSVGGYQQIKIRFSVLSSGLKGAINGTGSASNFSDF